MLKKTFLVLLAFLFSFKLAQASLIINEVMYDLPGSDSSSGKSREWVEIYNPGPLVEIDASKWRFFDGSGDRTINNGENFSIPSESYVVFAGDKNTFLSDHQNFSGSVYDTGITSLNNTGATLKLLDESGNTVDSFSYTSSQGADGDGNSLQKVSGAWNSSIPSPGYPNETKNSPKSEEGIALDSPSENFSVQKTKIIEQPKIKTKILPNKLFAFTGIPIEFKLSTIGYSGETLNYGNYFINFGDGDSKELKANETGKFTHIFNYEGEYGVSLEYFENYYSIEPIATDKIVIKIISPTISISSVGDEKDFYIKIFNGTEVDADVSRWTILGLNKNFVLPRNTVILPKKEIILSPKITGFSILDKDNLKLLNSQGETVFDYSSISKSPEIKKGIKLASFQNDNSVKSKGNNKNLLAQAIDSTNNNPDFSNTDSSPKENIFKYLIGLFLILGISGAGAYFIRNYNRKVIESDGSDFEIIDE